MQASLNGCWTATIPWHEEFNSSPMEPSRRAATASASGSSEPCSFHIACDYRRRHHGNNKGNKKPAAIRCGGEYIEPACLASNYPLHVRRVARRLLRRQFHSPTPQCPEGRLQDSGAPGKRGADAPRSPSESSLTHADRCNVRWWLLGVRAHGLGAPGRESERGLHRPVFRCLDAAVRYLVLLAAPSDSQPVALP